MCSLLLIAHLVGCGTKRNNCPPFPLPSEHVTITLDDLSEKDNDIKEWLNRLLDLCQQLGDCE